MIIGITGTLGSGKGEVAKYLVQKGFRHYSARTVITEEVVRRGLPVNRDTMTVVANDMRKRDPAYPQTESYARAMADGAENAVFESVREVAGAEFLKKQGAVIVAIDADSHARHQRAVARGSETDEVDFDTFVAHEKREMENADLTKQNIRKVMAMADYTLTNNGTLDELHAQVDKVLATLQK